MSALTGLTGWDVRMGSSSIIINDRDCIGVIHGASLFRFSRKTRELAVRPQSDEQITDWYDRYADCLAEAKEIVMAGRDPAERTAR